MGNSTKTGSRLGAARAGEGGEQPFHVDGIFLGGYENVLELERGDGCGTS